MENSIISAVDLCLTIRLQRQGFWPRVLVAHEDELNIDDEDTKPLVELVFDTDEKVSKLYVQVNDDRMTAQGVIGNYQMLECLSAFHQNDDDDDHNTWLEADSKETAALIVLSLLEKIFNINDFEDIRLLITDVRTKDECVVMDMDGAWRRMIGFSDIENTKAKTQMR